MNKITATIITKNSAATLADCLESIHWVAEIVVVDQGSTDGTLEICTQFGAKIIQSQWLGFGRTKQLAVDEATNNWILSIDSDEVCSQELKTEIQNLSEEMLSFSAFKIKRVNYFLGVPIKYCGWQNDFPVRLFRRDNGGFNDRMVHEYVETQGAIGIINTPIFHHSFLTLSSFIQKTDTYSTISAQEAFEKGKKCSLLGAYGKSIYKFIYIYVFRFGFLDGSEGFVLAKCSAFSVYIKYIKLYELHKSKDQLLSKAKK